MQHTFNIVLTTSIYSAVVGLIIVLVKSLLRNRLNARWSYMLWMVLILKLLVPFGPESAWSLFNIVPEINEYSTERIVEQVQYIDIVNDTPNTISTAGEPIYPEPKYERHLEFQALLPYIWTAGAALMLIWLAASYYILFKGLHKGTYPAEDRVSRIYRGCMSKMGIKRPIPVVVQSAVSMPSLFGVSRPRILLPSNAAVLEDKELEYILMHELAHYKRKDIFINYLLLALQTVHWFNPIMWYCFKKIREDMELAADELVLSVLSDTEHKAYGRTLITILEGYSASRLAPRLLAMADDRKSIERRLKMIRMAELFKRRKRLAIIVGILCIALLGGILLTNGVTGNGADKTRDVVYNAEKLLENRTENVGDNAKVASIMNSLPYGGNIKQIALQTKTKPYDVTVSYEFSNNQPSEQQLQKQLYDNAAIAFALIQNVDTINFQLLPAETKWIHTREKTSSQMNVDLWSLSKDTETFERFLKDMQFKVHAAPRKYSLAMSSTPGVKIIAEYEGDAEISTIRYAAVEGGFLTLERSSGEISRKGNIIELPGDKEIYWSPMVTADISKMSQENRVTITLLDKAGKELSSREIKIIKDGSTFEVLRGPGILTDTGAEEQSTMTIEEGVRNAILTKASAYLTGEAATEGHVILSEHKEGSASKIYAIVSIGNFGFENGIFTKVSGSGAIPTVITLDNRPENKYALIEYKEPMDGALYGKSIREMFPPELQKEALDAQKYYPELRKQQEMQAGEYLRSIGRTANISEKYVKKTLADINVDASNKLFSEMGKYDSFINSCPYWLGTVEKVESGVRYIYQTSQTKTNDGYDMIIFTKTKDDGTVIKQVKYKIDGPRVEQIE